MGERRNYYRILGVQPDATRGVIRGSYRTMMQKLQMHPDLGGCDRTAATINAAWLMLQDPERRAAYDQQLLDDYDIRMIAGGGEAVSSTARVARSDRRNYYRILGVQPDAPSALIDSAYRVMRQVATDNGPLLAEAYGILSDPVRRGEYDAVLAGKPVTDAAEGDTEADTETNTGKTADAASDTTPKTADTGEYEPVISHFCYFCKTPRGNYPGAVEPDRCAECDSPLQRPESVSSSLQRSFRRTRLAGNATLFDYWPGPGWVALLQDLTPDGLRLVSARALVRNQVIRVQASDFDAVARVVHCQTDATGCRAGLMLLATAFSGAGVFLDLRT